MCLLLSLFVTHTHLNICDTHYYTVCDTQCACCAGCAHLLFCTAPPFCLFEYPSPTYLRPAHLAHLTHTSHTPYTRSPTPVEPTTRLSTRDATIVMHLLRKIASTGRTVICTLHQPRGEVFSVRIKKKGLHCPTSVVNSAHLRWWTTCCCSSPVGARSILVPWVTTPRML